MINNNEQYIFKQLSKYVNENHAQKLEYFFIEKYKKNQFKILNISKSGGLGTSSERKWSHDKIILKVKEYNNYTEFYKNSALRSAAIRYNLIDFIKENIFKMNKNK